MQIPHHGKENVIIILCRDAPARKKSFFNPRNSRRTLPHPPIPCQTRSRGKECCGLQGAQSFFALFKLAIALQIGRVWWNFKSGYPWHNGSMMPTPLRLTYSLPLKYYKQSYRLPCASLLDKRMAARMIRHISNSSAKEWNSVKNSCNLSFEGKQKGFEPTRLSGFLVEQLHRAQNWSVTAFSAEDHVPVAVCAIKEHKNVSLV